MRGEEITRCKKSHIASVSFTSFTNWCIIIKKKKKKSYPNQSPPLIQVVSLYILIFNSLSNPARTYNCIGMTVEIIKGVVVYYHGGGGGWDAVKKLQHPKSTQKTLYTNQTKPKFNTPLKCVRTMNFNCFT